MMNKTVFTMDGNGKPGKLYTIALDGARQELEQRKRLYEYFSKK